MVKFSVRKFYHQRQIWHWNFLDFGIVEKTLREVMVKIFREPNTILDFGCGVFQINRRVLEEIGYKYNSIDVIEVGDSDLWDGKGALPYQDGTFDTVLANGVMFLLKDLVEVKAELARVLKPDGFLVFSSPIVSPLSLPYKPEDSFQERIRLMPSAVADFYHDDGFQVIDIRTVGGAGVSVSLLLYILWEALFKSKNGKFRLPLLPLLLFFIPLSLILNLLGMVLNKVNPGNRFSSFYIAVLQLKSE